MPSPVANGDAPTTDRVANVRRMDQLSRDGFSCVCDYCDARGIAILSLTCRRFARHLGAAPNGEGCAYPWATRLQRALAHLPQRRTVMQSALPEPSLDCSGMDSGELLHMVLYFEEIAFALPVYRRLGPEDAGVLAAKHAATPSSSSSSSLSLSSSMSSVSFNDSGEDDSDDDDSDDDPRRAKQPALASNSRPTSRYVPPRRPAPSVQAPPPRGGSTQLRTVAMRTKTASSMTYSGDPADFVLRSLNESQGMMELCDSTLTAAFQQRLDRQLAVVLLAASGASDVAETVKVPADPAHVLGPANTIVNPEAPPGDNPLNTILFPLYVTAPQSAASSPSAGTGGRPVHRDPTAEMADQDSDGNEFCSDSEEDELGDEALKRRHQVAALRAKAAANAGLTRSLPGAPRYAPGPLRMYSGLLAHAVVTKFQHFYSPWDWKRAVVVRLTGPTGGTAEIRFFVMMRLGSFPCFRSLMVWCPSGWRSGDVLHQRFGDAPEEVKELFACGYGRVEMDIRPRFNAEQFAMLVSTLGLPVPAFPIELLWNAIVATCIGNLMSEHVSFINVQYRTSIRDVFTRTFIL